MQWDIINIIKLLDSVVINPFYDVKLKEFEVIIANRHVPIYKIYVEGKKSNAKINFDQYYFQPRWTSGRSTIQAGVETPGYINIKNNDTDSEYYYPVAECLAVPVDSTSKYDSEGSK